MATNNEDNLAKFRQSMVWNERSTIRAKFSRLSIPKFIFHSIHAYRISLQVNHFDIFQLETQHLPSCFNYLLTLTHLQLETITDSNHFKHIYTPSSLPRVAKNQFQTARPIAGIERTTAKLGNDAPNDQLAKMFGQFRGAIRLWNETISLHLGIWHDNGEWPSLEQ